MLLVMGKRPLFEPTWRSKARSQAPTEVGYDLFAGGSLTRQETRIVVR